MRRNFVCSKVRIENHVPLERFVVTLELWCYKAKVDPAIKNLRPDILFRTLQPWMARNFLTNVFPRPFGGATTQRPAGVSDVIRTLC